MYIHGNTQPNNRLPSNRIPGNRLPVALQPNMANFFGQPSRPSGAVQQGGWTSLPQYGQGIQNNIWGGANIGARPIQIVHSLGPDSYRPTPNANGLFYKPLQKPWLEQQSEKALDAFAAVGDWWGGFKKNSLHNPLNYVGPIADVSDYKNTVDPFILNKTPSLVSRVTGGAASFLNALTSSLDVAETFAKEHAAGSGYNQTMRGFVDTVGKTTVSGLAGSAIYGGALAGGALIAGTVSAPVVVPAVALGLGGAYLAGQAYDWATSWAGDKVFGPRLN